MYLVHLEQILQNRSGMLGVISEFKVVTIVIGCSICEIQFFGVFPNNHVNYSNATDTKTGTKHILQKSSKILHIHMHMCINTSRCV